MIVRLFVFVFFIFSSNVYSETSEEQILNKAEELYNEEKFDESESEFLKLIDSKDAYYKAQGYYGLGVVNYWQEGKEGKSLEYFNFLIENELLLSEISHSYKVDLYSSLGWLNFFVGNAPYEFRYYNLAINEYENFIKKPEAESKKRYCDALFNISIAYKEGSGTKQNHQKAFETFNKSATVCEDSESMNYIGMMYEQGLYVEQDFTMASEWYIKSMDVKEYTSLYAKINYGYLLANGFGVTKNIELAKQYYDEVANTKEDYYALDEVVKLAKEYKSLLTSMEGSENKNLNYVDSFICGDIESLAKVGNDVSNDFHLCLNAAENNNVAAQFYIGHFYQNNIGVIKDLNIAANWYFKASKQNDNAKLRLAQLIQQGRTNIFSIDKAVELLLELKNKPEKKDSKNFVLESTYELGIIYLHGVGIEKDLDKAKEYFEEIVFTNNNLTIIAQKQLDYIKAIKAGFATESNIVKFFPAVFKGNFIWEGDREARIISKLEFEKITQVGISNFKLEGYYIDEEKYKVEINGYLDSKFNNVEIWEKNPRNQETNELTERIELSDGSYYLAEIENFFDLNGSYLGFFDDNFSNIKAHWVPYSSGTRGILQLERTNKIETEVEDLEIIKNLNFGKYYALVIGNNNYESMTPSLETAIADANAVSDVLKNKYGFEIVDTITDGNYQRIVAALNNLKNTIGPYDNLLIYYAGHGHQDVNTGYWIPVDGADPSEDDDSYWISSERISRAVSKIPAKHILIVADSCYSGTLVERGSRTQLSSDLDYYTNLLNKKTRRAITSGANEPVVDGGGEGHSIFASAFLKILSSQNSIIETSELYTLLKRKVSQEVPQTPQYGRIPKTGDEGGDFIFVPIN